MKLSALCICVLGVALATDPPQRSNPGVRIRITKHALDGINNLVGKGAELVSQLIPMGLQYQVKGVSFGEAEYLANEPPKIEFSFADPNILKLQITGGDLKMKLPVTTVGAAPKKGTVTLTIGAHDDELALAFTEQATGKLGIEKSACKIGSHDQLTVEVEGLPADNEARVELESFPMQVQMMTQMFCTMLDSYLGKAQLVLAKHDFVANMDDVSFDYSITSPPKATEDYMQMDFLAKFNLDKPSKRQTLTVMEYNPTPMPEGSFDRWFHFFLNDEVLNQVAREGWRTGDLDSYPVMQESVDLFQKKAVEAGIYEQEYEVTAKLNFGSPPEINFVDEPEVGIRLKVPLEVEHTKVIDGEEKKTVAEVYVEAEEGRNVNLEDPLQGDRLTITKVEIKNIDGDGPQIPEEKWPKVEEIAKEVFQKLVTKLETEAYSHLKDVDKFAASQGKGREHEMAKEFVEEDRAKLTYHNRVAELMFDLLVHFEKLSNMAKSSIGA